MTFPSEKVERTPRMDILSLVDKPRIIHVGFPKTGTTWVQKVIVPALREAGAVDYSIGQSENGHPKWQVDAMFRAARAVMLAGDSQKLKEEFNRPSFFISAETWTGDSSLNHESRAEMLASLTSPKSTILITARPLEPLLNSLFQEQIKSRLYTSEEEFFFQKKARYHAPPWHFEHLSLLNALVAYRTKFNRVVVVDQARLSDLDWLSELGFTNAIVDEMKQAAKNKRKRENSSLGPLAISFLLQVNKLISLLALMADAEADARTPFSQLPNRHKARELPARIAIVAKVKFLVPILQKMSRGGVITLGSAKTLAENMGGEWQWEAIENYARLAGGITVIR